MVMDVWSGSGAFLQGKVGLLTSAALLAVVEAGGALSLGPGADAPAAHRIPHLVGGAVELLPADAPALRRNIHLQFGTVLLLYSATTGTGHVFLKLHLQPRIISTLHIDHDDRFTDDVCLGGQAGEEVVGAAASAPIQSGTGWVDKGGLTHILYFYRNFD